MLQGRKKDHICVRLSGLYIDKLYSLSSHVEEYESNK